MKRLMRVGGGCFGLVAVSTIALAQQPSTTQPQKEKEGVLQRWEEEGGEFNSANGFDVLRIEQEDKITVPPEKADEVWEFLLQYLIKDTAALKRIHSGFTSSFAIEQFTDTYFDTPDLQVHSRGGGIRHRRRVNLDDADADKSGRELMQIKLNDISSKELERGEYKYEIKRPASFESPEDRHPMVGIVSPSQRADFKKRLQTMGLDAMSMKPMLTVHDLRKRIYLLRDGEPFMSISHDTAHAGLLWAKFNIIEIEPELNEITYTEANQQKRDYMETVAAEITGTLMNTFPELKRDLIPKYGKAFNAFEGQIPRLRLLVRTDLYRPGKLAGAGVLGLTLIGGAVLLGVKLRSQQAAV
jgi:hypothetical protein